MLISAQFGKALEVGKIFSLLSARFPRREAKPSLVMNSCRSFDLAFSAVRFCSGRQAPEGCLGPLAGWSVVGVRRQEGA